MNEYLKNLNRLEFVVTTACTGRCKHCSQGDHKSTEHIETKLAADVVREVAGEYKIESVMTFGGEPLLYPETVCGIHKTAKEMCIPRRQLITNGYFSKDFNQIKLTADNLIECGVNEFLLSVDAFHQETIPLEYVKAFAENVRKNGTEILVHPAWLVSKEDENAYNIRTKALLQEFSLIGIEASEGNVIFPAGNALKFFREYFDLSKIEKNPYQEDQRNIKAICIGADGKVLDGNINYEKITNILSNYAPEET